jgi:hypothetical protein
MFRLASRRMRRLFPFQEVSLTRPSHSVHDMGSSCTVAAKILGYNSQIQRQSYGADDPSAKPDLKALLKDYESRRWLPTTCITAKAAFLGELRSR